MIGGAKRENPGASSSILCAITIATTATTGSRNEERKSNILLRIRAKRVRKRKENRTITNRFVGVFRNTWFYPSWAVNWRSIIRERGRNWSCSKFVPCLLCVSLHYGMELIEFQTFGGEKNYSFPGDLRFRTVIKN